MFYLLSSSGMLHGCEDDALKNVARKANVDAGFLLPFTEDALTTFLMDKAGLHPAVVAEILHATQDVKVHNRVYLWRWGSAIEPALKAEFGFQLKIYPEWHDHFMNGGI